MAELPPAPVATGVLAVTAARDEAHHIGRLVDAVLGMSPRPARWIVIDDGSTDGTAAYMRERCASAPWVTVEVREHAGPRADASKARCLNDAVAAWATEETSVVVVLDADIVPPTGYLQHVLAAFDDDPTLGVFGGVCNHPDSMGTATEPFPADIVPGGAAAVRHRTWLDIGGMWELPFGGLDIAACLAAQHAGWQTRNDPALECLHLRRTGTGGGRSVLRAAHRRGREDFDLGAPWWFEVLKAIRWSARRPYVVGALALTSGYLRSGLTRTRRTPPAWFVEHARRRCRARTVAEFRRLARSPRSVEPNRAR